MTEKTFIILLSLIFLGTFAARNLVVKARVRQQIRSSDLLTTTAIVLFTLCILVTIASTFSADFYRCLGAILFLRSPVVSYVGLFLFGLSILLGWMISAQLQESWRVGVSEEQQTELIQTGVYAYIRNPYFLSYFLMFFSLLLVRPSLVLAGLAIATTIVFHVMVLREEAFLRKAHGNAYEQYRRKTGRYLPRAGKR